MTAAPLAKLVPRTVWDIADDALDLYRARFFPLCGLAALFLGVPMVAYLSLISGPLQTVFQSAMEARTGSPPPDAAIWNLTAASLLATPLFWLGRAMMDGPVAAVVGEYLTTGEYSGIGDAVRRALRHWGPLIGSSLIVALAITVSSVVTGIVVFAILPLCAFVGPAVVLEGKGTRAALKRSFSLNRGAFGKTLGLILLMQSFPGFLAIAFALILFVGFSMIPLGGGDPQQEISRRIIIGFALLMISSIIVMPLEAIARTLLYFDIRVRREGLDVVSQAIEQDYPLMDDPFGDMSSEEARQRQLKATRR